MPLVLPLLSFFVAWSGLVLSLYIHAKGYAPQLLAAVGEQRAALLVVHTLGIAFGLGGATVSDILFFNFLRDFRISPKESRVLRTLSQVIWLALAVLFLSGLGLYLPKMDVLNHSSKFLLKVVVVCVIIVNGAFLNLLIAPNLTRLSFDGRRDATEKKLRRMRKIAFALGGVSFTSWYSAFILGSLRSVPLAFWQLLLVYGVLLALAVLASQVVARQIFRRARARPALSSPHV